MCDLFSLSVNRFSICVFFFFQAEDGIRDADVTGVQTCALPIFRTRSRYGPSADPAEFGSWRRSASRVRDRKSTRLNSSHVRISYAVFCLKKKKKRNQLSKPANKKIKEAE